MPRPSIPFLLAAFSLLFLTFGNLANAGETLPAAGEMDLKRLGLKGDGQTDDTAALQAAMDSAAQAGGGTIQLPAGSFLIAGSLKIPHGVALKGAGQAIQHTIPRVGTILLATGGRQKEDGPALFEMGSSSYVGGLSVHYPQQDVKKIVPYAWTFHLQGCDNTIENVTLFNSYNGIRIGPENNYRHTVRNVAGCVLRRGIWVDQCVDVGRIQDVQFHCDWWNSTIGGNWDLVYEYMWKNLEAFTFGRSDWEYVTNTFVFPANIGYRWVKTAKVYDPLREAGAANGQFCGIGADAAQNCLVVDEVQPMGLLITNGQFVAFNGDNPIGAIVQDTCSGSVRLVNCAFWGPVDQAVVSRSKSFLSLSDCYFSSGRSKPSDKALIEVSGGKLQVRGCSFATSQPSIDLLPGLKHAIITENNGEYGVVIRNQIGQKAVLSNNEPRP